MQSYGNNHIQQFATYQSNNLKQCLIYTDFFHVKLWLEIQKEKQKRGKGP